MKAQDAVRQQLAFWHGTLGAMMADCNDEVVNKKQAGSTTDTIAQIYAHIMFSQDMLANGLILGKAPLYVRDGWDAKTGVPYPEGSPELGGEWKNSMKMKLPEFQEYSKAIQAEVDNILANLTEEDMKRTVRAPFGEQKVEWVVANLLGTHMPAHAGEIAALKGAQGLKGLPF